MAISSSSAAFSSARSTDRSDRVELDERPPGRASVKLVPPRSATPFSASKQRIFPFRKPCAPIGTVNSRDTSKAMDVFLIKICRIMA